ncbi:hypothetical protein QP157_12780 [Sphingomonas sp. LR61]|uniref:hypothetical protein n=1 Tax=Sphingomonas sp. LR61 TaxID=3050234 RepID=UPI002FE1E637
MHVDLDVLDPSEVDGLSRAGAVRTRRRRDWSSGSRPRPASRRLAGAALTGFAPVDPERAVDDLGVILRVVGALTSASRVA